MVYWSAMLKRYVALAVFLVISLNLVVQAATSQPRTGDWLYGLGEVAGIVAQMFIGRWAWLYYRRSPGAPPATLQPTATDTSTSRR